MRVRQDEEEEEEEMVVKGWTVMKDWKEKKGGMWLLEGVSRVMDEKKVMRIACVLLVAVLLFYVYQTNKLKE